MDSEAEAEAMDAEMVALRNEMKYQKKMVVTVVVVVEVVMAEAAEVAAEAEAVMIALPHLQAEDSNNHYQALIDQCNIHIHSTLPDLKQFV